MGEKIICSPEGQTVAIFPKMVLIRPRYLQVKILTVSSSVMHVSETIYIESRNQASICLLYCTKSVLVQFFLLNLEEAF